MGSSSPLLDSLKHFISHNFSAMSTLQLLTIFHLYAYVTHCSLFLLDYITAPMLQHHYTCLIASLYLCHDIIVLFQKCTCVITSSSFYITLPALHHHLITLLYLCYYIIGYYITMPLLIHCCTCFCIATPVLSHLFTSCCIVYLCCYIPAPHFALLYQCYDIAVLTILLLYLGYYIPVLLLLLLLFSQ